MLFRSRRRIGRGRLVTAEAIVAAGDVEEAIHVRRGHRVRGGVAKEGEGREEAEPVRVGGGDDGIRQGRGVRSVEDREVVVSASEHDRQARVLGTKGSGKLEQAPRSLHGLHPVGEAGGEPVLDEVHAVVRQEASLEEGDPGLLVGLLVGEAGGLPEIGRAHV